MDDHGFDELYAMTASLPDAEDAVQEAFARASRRWRPRCCR
jgi:DNA-directed RNA polymerase specialized sigma24 family protein